MNSVYEFLKMNPLEIEFSDTENKYFVGIYIYIYIYIYIFISLHQTLYVTLEFIFLQVLSLDK